MRISPLLWLALVWPGWAGAAPVEPPVRPPGSVEFLSDYRGSGFLLHFVNRRGEYQKDRFVTEGGLELDFSLAAWPASDVRMRFALITGMGRSVADNLPFSPKEMTYEINPFYERRTARLRYRAGLEHACQHLIYKDYDEPWYLEEGHDISADVYFNRLHAGVGSLEARREVLVQTWLGADAAPSPRPWIWQVEAGAYLRSLGSFMDAEALHGDNDWTADLKGDLMVPLHRRTAWALFAASRTHVLFDTNAKAVWRTRLELEAFFARRGFGSSAFVSWNAVDEHPRDSRERLIELGGRFFF